MTSEPVGGDATDASTDADKMATDKDDETSGDADQSVTIGGEKDPSLSN